MKKSGVEAKCIARSQRNADLFSQFDEQAQRRREWTVVLRERGGIMGRLLVPGIVSIEK